MIASPADYDLQKYQKKESFNTGVVPFGSASKQQSLYKSRVTQLSPTNLNTPGPGSYTAHTSHTTKNNRVPVMTSFGTSGMNKLNGSTSRVMAYQTSDASTKVTQNESVIRNASL